MHPYANFCGSGQAPNLFQLLTHSRAVEPGVDAVEAHFATRGQQPLKDVADILRAVLRGPKRGRRAIQRSAWAVLERNHEESRADTFFEFQVAAVEIAPEVFDEADESKRQL